MTPETMVVPTHIANKGPALGLLARRSYQLSRGRLVPAQEQPGLRVEPEHVSSVNPGALERLANDTDLACFGKPSTDVLVRGSAHSTRGPVRTLDTAVRVGSMGKSVRVWGHRVVELGPQGRLGFSASEAFQSLPLTWDHAYGGRDSHAEDKLHPRAKWSRTRRDEEPPGAVFYRRNPAGRGFFLDLDRERIAGTSAPNLEDPDDPVTPDRLLAKSDLDWMDRPVAACYEPVDWFSFPRQGFWLRAAHEAPSRPVYEVRKGLLRAADLGDRSLETPPDPRVYNCAPVGLSGARLLGNERVSLWNLHPSREILELDLPGERPKLLLEPPGCGIHELPALLQTVLIEPDQERVTLTWAGSLQVAAPFEQEACETMRRAVQWQR